MESCDKISSLLNISHSNSVCSDNLLDAVTNCDDVQPAVDIEAVRPDSINLKPAVRSSKRIRKPTSKYEPEPVKVKKRKIGAKKKLTDSEKVALYISLMKNGLYDTNAHCQALPSVKSYIVRKFIKYYKVKGQKLMKSRKLKKKTLFKEHQHSITAWMNVLKFNRNSKFSPVNPQILSQAFEVIAETESHPPPEFCDGINYQQLYHALSRVLKGDTIGYLDARSAKFLHGLMREIYFFAEDESSEKIRFEASTFSPTLIPAAKPVKPNTANNSEPTEVNSSEQSDTLNSQPSEKVTVPPEAHLPSKVELFNVMQWNPLGLCDRILLCEDMLRRFGKLTLEECMKTVTEEESGTKETGAKEPGTKETGTKETGTKETGTKETGTKETGTKESGTKETGTKETGAKEPGTKETGTKETGTKETGTKESGTKETGTKESGTKETVTKKTVPKDKNSSTSNTPKPTHYHIAMTKDGPKLISVEDPRIFDAAPNQN